MINDLAINIGIDSLLKDSKKSGEDILEDIRNIINRERYPMLSKINDEISREVAKFEWPEFIKIRWDKSLEKSGFIVEFDINNQTQIDGVIKYFQKDDLFKKLKKIWELFEKYGL